MARKTDEQRLEELEQAKSKLAEREKAIKARLRSKDRKIRNRRIAIIGAVVEAHAQHDAQFADYLWMILKNRVTREADRDFLGLPALDNDKAKN
jgi:hypothetical protein